MSEKDLSQPMVNDINSENCTKFDFFIILWVDCVGKPYQTHFIFI